MTQVAEFLPIHSPVEGAANISTVQPEFDIILVIGHRVLTTCRSGTTIEEGKETHADNGEKGDDCTENSRGWCDARGLLRKIQTTDSYIQQR